MDYISLLLAAAALAVALVALRRSKPAPPPPTMEAIVEAMKHHFLLMDTARSSLFWRKKDAPVAYVSQLTKIFDQVLARELATVQDRIHRTFSLFLKYYRERTIRMLEERMGHLEATPVFQDEQKLAAAAQQLKELHIELQSLSVNEDSPSEEDLGQEAVVYFRLLGKEQFEPTDAQQYISIRSDLRTNFWPQKTQEIQGQRKGAEEALRDFRKRTNFEEMSQSYEEASRQVEAFHQLCKNMERCLTSQPPSLPPPPPGGTS